LGGDSIPQKKQILSLNYRDSLTLSLKIAKLTSMKEQIIKKNELLKAKAIELLALDLHANAKDVCNKLNISPRTLNYWKSDPDFVEAIYSRYMVKFGLEIPAVLNAMTREAKQGNVSAARLVLEHSGKLVKNINVTIDSPFEKFLRDMGKEEIITDSEIIDVAENIEDDFEELPPRKVEDQRKREHDEKIKNLKEIKKETKRVKRNAKQKEWYMWKKRAEAVGIKPLPSKRPTPAQRQDWEKSIIEAEIAK
tara:strand:- start:1199 stop:1951 length:753 start_codon:yes stop_codon:yes gene_type:complete